jgi:hypothetical protein
LEAGLFGEWAKFLLTRQQNERPTVAASAANLNGGSVIVAIEQAMIGEFEGNSFMDESLAHIRPGSNILHHGIATHGVRLKAGVDFELENVLLTSSAVGEIYVDGLFLFIIPGGIHLRAKGRRREGESKEAKG